MAHQDDELEDLVEFRIRLDDLTVARLMEVADNAHADPRVVVAAIIRDVLEDDARANYDGPFGPTPTHTLN